MSGSPSASLPSFWQEMGIVLLTGLFARSLVLLVLPRDAISYDLRAWSEVARILATGQNPYNLQPT